MDGNEKVCIGIVGNLCPSVQSNKYVRLSGIHDFYIGTIGLDELPQFQSYIQVDGLFLAAFADGTGVSAPMSGVDYYRKISTFRINPDEREGGP